MEISFLMPAASDLAEEKLITNTEVSAHSFAEVLDVSSFMDENLNLLSGTELPGQVLSGDSKYSAGQKESDVVSELSSEGLEPFLCKRTPGVYEGLELTVSSDEINNNDAFVLEEKELAIGMEFIEKENLPALSNIDMSVDVLGEAGNDHGSDSGSIDIGSISKKPEQVLTEDPGSLPSKMSISGAVPDEVGAFVIDGEISETVYKGQIGQGAVIAEKVNEVDNLEDFSRELAVDLPNNGNKEANLNKETRKVGIEEMPKTASNEELPLKLAREDMAKAVEGSSRSHSGKIEAEKAVSTDIDPDLCEQQADSGAGDSKNWNNEKNANGMGRNLFISRTDAFGLKSPEMMEEGISKLTDPFVKAQSGIDRIEFGRLAANGRKGEVRIDLNHPSMGRLQVELNVDADAVKAVFHTETQAVKAVLEGSMQDLKDAFSERELDLENFDVRSDGEGEGWAQKEREERFDLSEELIGEGLDGDEYLHETDSRIALPVKMEGLDIFV